MKSDDFLWHSILAGMDAGEHLRCGAVNVARVLPFHTRGEWTATVNLHKASTEHRSSNFYSKGEARAAVDGWLRSVVLVSGFFP
jgi:hypothetical protein